VFFVGGGLPRFGNKKREGDEKNEASFRFYAKKNSEKNSLEKKMFSFLVVLFFVCLESF
jgi:hypothetical protein